MQKALIISQEESNKMFPNIDGMIGLSNQIHEEMSNILKTWDRR